MALNGFEMGPSRCMVRKGLEIHSSFALFAIFGGFRPSSSSTQTQHTRVDLLVGSLEGKVVTPLPGSGLRVERGDGPLGEPPSWPR